MSEKLDARQILEKLDRNFLKKLMEVDGFKGVRYTKSIE